MEFLDLVRSRYSCRDYKDTPVSDELLNKILEAGNLAPTAKNLQPQRIYVIKSEDNLKKIREITPCAFNAPVVFIFAYDTDEDWKNVRQEGIHSGVEDVSIVATHMMLEATSLGLATCWVNAYPNAVCDEAFNLPSNQKSVLLMPLGYPNDEPCDRHTMRKDIEATVSYL